MCVGRGAVSVWCVPAWPQQTSLMQDSCLGGVWQCGISARIVIVEANCCCNGGRAMLTN